MPQQADFETQTGNSILLIGGGGHCKYCIDVIKQGGKYQIAGVVDLPEKQGQSVLGYAVLGTGEDLEP